MASVLFQIAHVSADDAIHFDTEMGVLFGVLLIMVLTVIWLL